MMAFLTDLLLNYGYWGMLIAAFLAGSFFPFSSEAILVALQLAGLNVWSLIIVSTIGNVAGGMFNYAVGRLGNDDMVYKMFKVKASRLEKTKRYVQHYGVMAGLLSWIPILGSATTIAMGLMKTNLLKSFISIFIGKFVRYLVIGFILIGIDACNPIRTYKTTKPTIMVSIEPYRYFVTQIAGNRFKVKSMVPKGRNPEEYRPSASRLASLSKSIAYIRVGNIGFEDTWLNDALKQESHLQIFNSSDSLATHHRLLDSDQHIWMSPKNVRLISASICNALCQLDSANQQEYRTNLKHFQQHVDSIDLAIHKQLKPLSTRTFGIVHPALTYYATDYGLQQIAIQHNGRDCTPSTILNVIRQMKKDGAKLLFTQKEFSSTQSKIVAKSVGVKTITINPLDYNWDTQILFITNQLTDAGK